MLDVNIWLLVYRHVSSLSEKRLYLTKVVFISKSVGSSASLPTVLFDCTDLLSDCLKHLLDTGALFGGHFGPDHFVLLSKFDGTSLVNPLLFYRDVALVTGQCHDKPILVCGRVRLHLVDPVFDGLERRLVGQIVANNGADRVPIVHVDH